MEEEKYNVYLCTPNAYYNGFALVAAKNAEEAKKYIQKFKEEDWDNKWDSRGYCDHIVEEDQMDHLTSDMKGIIHHGIYYSG